MSQATSNEQLWQPSTFLERGVAVPFTTPILMGARARPAARFVELIVPHPAGVRGVYIMAWSELTNFCPATLHDLCLAERIAGLAAVTPRDIRAAARAVAAEGAAGRSARQAAHDVDAAERTERLMTNIALLQMLVAQTGGGTGPPAELDRRAKAAILRIVPSIGRTAEQITADIEQLAWLYAGIGVKPTADRARCTKLLDSLARLRIAIGPLITAEGSRAGLAASLVASAADVTTSLARTLLADTRAKAEDLPALLAAYAADPHATAAALVRVEWLLDGWEQIAALWQLADAGDQRATISEMAFMVPGIPKQVSDWMGTSVDESDRQRQRKLVHRFEDWRSGGLVYELIARNELIRAIAA
jgi:hypothetical protein